MPGSESPTSDQQSSNTDKQQYKPSAAKKRTFHFTFDQQDNDGAAITHKKENDALINKSDKHITSKNIDNYKNLSPLSNNGLFHKRANRALRPLAPIPLALFDITAPQPLPPYEKDLAPEFYQPFLQKLFEAFKCNELLNDILEFKKPEHLFVLTGSAAKQLQDPSQRKPKDIDILCYQDLHQARHALTVKLHALEIPIIFDDLNGTLIINYENKHFKLQLIDRGNSPHCFPQQQTIVNIDGILMIEASVIPAPPEEPTLADDDPTRIIQLDELEPWQRQYISSPPK